MSNRTNASLVAVVETSFLGSNLSVGRARPATLSSSSNCFFDNPFRQNIFPPEIMPIRHGIEPGMTVLEIGPGNGTYTVETAGWVGDKGRVVAIDIAPQMIERVEASARVAGLDNIEARVADVTDLPFDDSSFDAIYMMSVICEIPAPGLVLAECHRVLKPGGVLAFSEIIVDPDYPLPQTLIDLATTAGFSLKRRTGDVFAYTLVFERVELTDPGAE